MVEVTLLFDEQELVELLMKEFNKRYSFDDISQELMRRYFDMVVNDGSCSLFYGAMTLENYVTNTWDSMTVIDNNDPEYGKVAKAWSDRTFEIDNGEVVAEYNKNYLVEWYN